MWNVVCGHQKGRGGDEWEIFSSAKEEQVLPGNRVTPGGMGRWGARTEFKKRVPSQEAAMRKGRGLDWGPTT